MSRVSVASLFVVSLFAFALTGCPQGSAPATPSVDAAPPPPTDPAPTPAPAEPTPAEPAPAPAPAAQTAPCSGTVTHAGQTMQVVAAVAVWDASKPGLKLTLLPFTPSAAEVERIRKDEAFFAVVEHAKQAGKNLNAQTPYATLSIEWPFEKEAVGDMGSAFCHLYIGFLKDGGSNMNLSFPADDKGKGITLQGKPEVGGEVTVTAKGADEFSGDAMSWDFRFQGPLQAALGE